MPILNLLGASKAMNTFIIILTIVVFILCAFVVVMLWWTEVKQKSKRQFFQAVGNWFKSLGDKISPNRPVKSVYTDKSRNYSGTEFLPVPAKAPTKEYTYEFVGWDKNYTDKNGNTVARPIFIQKVNTCVVNIYDDDQKTLLKSVTVEFGAGVDLSDIKPTKPDTKEFVYEFIGFDKDTKNVYHSQNVYAVYKAIPKKFTYTFYDRDGKQIVSQTTAIYGTPILVPEPPKSEGIGEQFAYWRGLEENMVLKQDEAFVAVFKKGVNPDAVIAEGAPRKKMSSINSVKLDIQNLRKSQEKELKTGAEIVVKENMDIQNEENSTQNVTSPNETAENSQTETQDKPEEISGVRDLPDDSDEFEPLEDFGEEEEKPLQHPTTRDIVSEYNIEINRTPNRQQSQTTVQERKVQKLEVLTDEENEKKFSNNITYIGQKNKK